MYHLAFFVLISDFGRCVSGSHIVISRCYKFICFDIRAYLLLSSLVNNSIIELTTDYSFLFFSLVAKSLIAFKYYLMFYILLALRAVYAIYAVSPGIASIA